MDEGGCTTAQHRRGLIQIRTRSSGRGRGAVCRGIVAAIGDFAWRIYEMKLKYCLLTVL